MDKKMTLGQTIRNRRKEIGLTIKELGKEVGLSEQAISQYELDKRVPDEVTIVKLAVALKTTALEFLVSAGKDTEEIKAFYGAAVDITKKFQLIDYIKAIHEENPDDKRISNIVQNINAGKELTEEDMEVISGYKAAEAVNDLLGGDLPIIPTPEYSSYELFKKLLNSLGYANEEFESNAAYLFKKIKKQIELEIQSLEDLQKK